MGHAGWPQRSTLSPTASPDRSCCGGGAGPGLRPAGRLWLLQPPVCLCFLLPRCVTRARRCFPWGSLASLLSGGGWPQTAPCVAAPGPPRSTACLLHLLPGPLFPPHPSPPPVAGVERGQGSRKRIDVREPARTLRAPREDSIAAVQSPSGQWLPAMSLNECPELSGHAGPVRGAWLVLSMPCARTTPGRVCRRSGQLWRGGAAGPAEPQIQGCCGSRVPVCHSAPCGGGDQRAAEMNQVWPALSGCHRPPEGTESVGSRGTPSTGGTPPP